MSVKSLWLTALVAALISESHAQALCYGRKAMLIEEAACNTASFFLEFEDNFDGNSLDTSKWIPAYGVVRDENRTMSQQWYSYENVIVEDGCLKLRARRDTLINKCYSIWVGSGLLFKCDDFYFSAGQVDSRKKFGYGIFEISCKIPKAKGVGSAFWTFGDPYRNEIDVFEFQNEHDALGRYNHRKAARVHRMNMHTDYNNDDDTENCPSNYTGPDFSEEFHTFTLLYTPQKIEWYVDGVLKRRSTLFYSLHGQPVDCQGLKKGEIYILDRCFPVNEMTVVLDLIVESNKNQPDEDTQLPVYMEIDYFRYYRQME
jgi:beta-glucanase (GH16 family)